MGKTDCAKAERRRRSEISVQLNHRGRQTSRDGQPDRVERGVIDRLTNKLLSLIIRLQADGTTADGLSNTLMVVKPGDRPARHRLADEVRGWRAGVDFKRFKRNRANQAHERCRHNDLWNIFRPAMGISEEQQNITRAKARYRSSSVCYLSVVL